MRATRYRQFPRDAAAIGPPVVRHDVFMVPENPRKAAKRLHGGIALEAEATLLFDAARRESREAIGPAFAIVLERVTVETLAIQPPASRDVVKPAPPPKVAITIDATGARLDGRTWRENALRTISNALAVPMSLLSPDEGRVAVRVWNASDGGRAESLDLDAVVVALFKMAAHHQGNASPNGQMIAAALEVPFPLTMPDLAARAVAVGLDPAHLWPWRHVPGCTDADIAARDDD